MLKRVLIFSPHFPPTNAADHQRVRMLLPYLQEHGWQAEVLAVDSACVASPVDGWLTAGLPAEVPVHRVQALGLGWSRIPGLGTLTFRALGALRRQGDELLRQRRFDLVYFSTTQFGVHGLGPRWQQQFGIPFVMDYQDPWVSDYYRNHPEVTPPGGRMKYVLADWLNRRQEPHVLRHCAGITSVSVDYLRQLEKRYEWLEIGEANAETLKAEKLKAESDEAKTEMLKSDNLSAFQHFSVSAFPTLVLPFPGDEADLQRVAVDGTTQNIFSPGDGKQHWVYVGVCIPQMFLALRAFFLALSDRLKEHPILWEKLRLHFIGTSYAPKGSAKKIVLPLAEEFGLGDLVTESTDRIPYSQTLRCLLDADALIVPGSDDPGYTASKIYPYLLAGKPLLAVFHENSSVVSLLKKVGGGVCVPFKTGETAAEIAGHIGQSWFASSPKDHGPRTTDNETKDQLSSLSALRFATTDNLPPAIPLDRAAFEPHTACVQARMLAEFFLETLKNQALKNSKAGRCNGVK